MRIYVVADATDPDGGHVVERLEQLGGEIVQLDRDDLPTYESLGAPTLIVLLGSRRSAHDAKWVHLVDVESDFVRHALAGHTPVLGICYGAQLIARALGGTSQRADMLEIGWHQLETIDEELCPSGPWGQFHNDVFVPPPTSQVLGRSATGPQCFVDASLGTRAIGWQFHPEVTASTFERWVTELYTRRDRDEFNRLIAEAYEHEARSRVAAHNLTDSALAFLGVRPPASPELVDHMKEHRGD